MEATAVTVTLFYVALLALSGSPNAFASDISGTFSSDTNLEIKNLKLEPLTLLSSTSSSFNLLQISPKDSNFKNSSQLIEQIKKKIITYTTSLSKKGGITPPPNTLFNRLSVYQTKNKPWISLSHSPNVTTYLGRTASLRCRIHNRMNYTVSWIRHRDLHLLTVDRYTYTSDQRFQAIHEPSSGDWVLIISSLQSRDRGDYECQISTTPPVGHFISLNIVEPETRLLGGADLHINLGSTLNLTCLVLYHPKPPDVSWLHEGKRIEYTSSRGGVSVVTESNQEVTRSSLLIQKAEKEDSGNYSCQPIGGASVTTSVHVLSGELRAAMQGSASHYLQSRSTCPLLAILVQVVLKRML